MRAKTNSFGCFLFCVNYAIHRIMFCILKSKFCLFVFFISFIGIYFLIPDKMFYAWYRVLAYFFIFSTAMTSTCIVKNLRERILLNKKAGKSFFAILLSVFGIIATQVCGIGVPLCGTALAGSIGISFLPAIAQSFFEDYAVYIIVFAILGQLYSLYLLKCWGKHYCITNT